MSKKLDPKEQLWPIGRINKTKLVDYLADQPLDEIEVFCNIFREVVKQETTQWRNLSSHSLVHHGSVFNYFYNPHGIMDPTERLEYLFEVTLEVHDENENLLHCHSVLQNFDNEMGSFHCAFDSVLIGAENILGHQKLQSFIRQCSKNGDHILHKWAKRGNYIDILIFILYQLIWITLFDMGTIVVETTWTKFYPILTPSHLEWTTLDILQDTYHLSRDKAWPFYY